MLIIISLHFYIYAHIYIYIYSSMLNSLQPEQKTCGMPTLRLVPLVFFRVLVVVTTGVGAVFRLCSYFRNLPEMEKSCVECQWSDPMNVKA